MGFLDLLKRGFFYNSKKMTTDKDHLVITDKKYVESLKKASKELEAIANEVEEPSIEEEKEKSNG